MVAERTGISPDAVLAASESTPAYLILFMFINTLVAAWGLPADLDAGLTQRAFAAPTGAAAVLQAGLIVIVGAVLLGSLARTPQQVTALAPPIGIALGMLGGCMWPLEIVGPTMRAVGHATAHAWAVDALMRGVGAGAGPSDVAVELLALAGFAVAFLLLALLAFRRTLLTARG